MLVILDVETTGLDPNDGHLLLEVAAKVAHPIAPFGLVSDTFHAVIRNNKEEAFNVANRYVQTMHEKTGLWDKLEDGEPLEKVDARLLSWLRQYVGPREGRITGNSIRLDMNFLDKYLPETAGYLHYRSLDISGLAWYAHENHEVPYYEKKLTHSAEEDIQESLEELRHVYEGLKGR